MQTQHKFTGGPALNVCTIHGLLQPIVRGHYNHVLPRIQAIREAFDDAVSRLLKGTKNDIYICYCIRLILQLRNLGVEYDDRSVAGATHQTGHTVYQPLPEESLPVRIHGDIRIHPLVAKFMRHVVPIYQIDPMRSSALSNQRPSSQPLSLIHISEPTRLRRISYAVFCLKKKK